MTTIQMKSEVDVKVDFFRKLLTELNLENYYPNKLTLIDAITIRSQKNIESNKGMKIIQRILATDHKAHINKIKIKDSQKHYHPMDIMTVIYNCCSQDLLAVLQSKLFLARVALPFIIPDETTYNYSELLWSLKSIIPELKTESKIKPENLADINQPIIFCLRLSELKRSKSKLLNNMFGEQLPDTFYHRGCTFGGQKRRISNGIVELACNLPSERKECNFQQFFTVLNLRGNSLEFKNQVKCLIEISSLVVIFVSREDLTIPENVNFVKDVINNNKSYLIAFVFEQPEEVNIRKYFEKIDDTKIVKDWNDDDDDKLNDADWHELVFAKINFLLNLIQARKLSDIPNVNRNKKNNSENMCGNIDGELDQIISRIHSEEAIFRKEKLLPLQTQCWSKIAILLRNEKLHKDIEYITEYVAKCHSKNRELRKNQYDMYKSSTCFIKKLIENVNTNNLCYIFNFLKQKLDLISVQVSSNFKNDLVNEEKPECENKENFNKIMSQASFGLEHIIREMSQVYETCCFNESLENTSITELPKIGARMLLEGFPLEIMDGDNAFVPLTWVENVFSELEIIIGNDKKILVVSVLGVQSSGKSTMLNTMFGLQLAVSAGRCTKGVFCSLIPVDKTNNQYDYDYIMVIDTEGLRATELENQNRNRDNELATFAIGLGDVAIVNIKGENFSEIQNILEIVIHAFIKLKQANKVKLKPTCLFVHQNVSSLNVETDLLTQRKKLLSNLDKITEVAAKGKKDEVIKLKEIIELNDKGIFYVPDLWQGTPPMAYVNDGYIDKITDIKKFVLKTEKKSLKLGSLKTRLVDLWKALLYEDFVFSFRNSEELLAHDKLDAKLTDITWTTQKKLIELKENLINELNNCDNDKISVKMYDLKTFIDKKCQELNDIMIENFTAFFENHELKHILIKWEIQTKTNIKNFIKKENSNIKDALDKEKKTIENKILNNATVSKYKTEFLNKAELTALELQKAGSGATNEEVKKRFDEIWKEFIEKLASTSSDPDEDLIFLKTTFQKFLKPLFSINKKFHKTFSENRLEQNPSLLEIRTENLKSKSVLMQLIANSNKYIEEADRLCCDTKEKMIANITSLFGQDINETHIKSIFIDKLYELFDCEKRNFTFENKFKDKVLLHFSQTAFQNFLKAKELFRHQNDSKLKIEKEKETYFMLFKNTYDNRSQDFIAANQIYNVVVGWFENSIFRKLANLISSNVQNRHKCFQTKKTFLQEVLQRLLVEDSFDNYMWFTEDLQNCLLEYLNLITNEILTSKDSKFETIFEAIIKTEILNKKHKFELALTTACETCIDLKSILNHLKEILQSELNMTENVETFTKLKINDLNSFRKTFLNKFENIEEECWTRISKKKSDIDKGSLTYFDRKTPSDLLSEHLIGCKEECPFCSNICDLTAEKHAGDHRCSLHRPEGVRGWHWKKRFFFFFEQRDKLVIENCSTGVDSSARFKHPDLKDDTYHPYKEYKKYFPKWDIPPDSSLQSSAYWKRFMAKFNDELADRYKTKPADIPQEWKQISVKEAKESLLRL